MIQTKTKVAGIVATTSVILLTMGVLDSFGLKFLPENISTGLIGLATPMFVIAFWIRKVDVKKLKKFLHIRS